LGGLPKSNLLRKGIRRETYLDIPSNLLLGRKGRVGDGYLWAGIWEEEEEMLD